MVHQESHKKSYGVIVAIFLIIIVFSYALLMSIRDRNGIRNVCVRTPEACSQTTYPGKVVK